MSLDEHIKDCEKKVGPHADEPLMYGMWTCPFLNRNSLNNEKPQCCYARYELNRKGYVFCRAHLSEAVY